MKKTWFVFLLVVFIGGCTPLCPPTQEDDTQALNRLNQVGRISYEHSIDDFNILNPSSSAASDYGKRLQ